MVFKFDSRTVFLTYPQSGDLTEEQIKVHLQVIGITWLRTAKELHADGCPHIHVVGQFSKRYQTRNERAFDVGGKHPNIQPVRSVRAALAYVAKDGEFTDFGPVPVQEEDVDWLAVARTSSEADYFRAALKARVSYMYASRFWTMAQTQEATEISTEYEADLTRECFELLVHEPLEGKTTVVLGPSGCGKTSWAKRQCIKPCLWVRHMDVLRSFRAGYHRSIIFDDMSFAHLPREAQIHIVDSHEESHMHCRYGVAKIPAGVQKIITANYYPFILDSAIERRVHKIQVLNIL